MNNLQFILRYHP